jgi:hypothetical protein
LPPGSLRNFFYFVRSSLQILTPAQDRGESPMARPPKPTDNRSRKVHAHITPEDYSSLSIYSRDCGFRAPGQMVAALVERLLIGGFSPSCFLQVGLDLREQALQNSARFESQMYFGNRPEPILPLKPISNAQWKRELKAISAEVAQTSTTEKQ